MDRIEKLVHSLMQRYQTSSPYELCEHIGIKILVMDLPESVHGFFVQLFKNHVIVLSSALSAQDRLAVCAHELGHIFLHDGTNVLEVQKNTNLCLPRFEREADYFAACLLLDGNTASLDYLDDTLTTANIAALTGVPETLVQMRFDPSLSVGSA